MNIVEMDEKGTPISKMYFSMSVPVVLGMVSTMIYSIADTWFISALGNTNLIAGVSLNAPVLTILMAFGNIFGQGGTSLISRLVGKRDHKTSRHVSSACFYMSVLVGVIAGVVMLIFHTPILYLLGASEETFAYAYDYYFWLAVGAPVIVIAFVPYNLIRAEGMANESMISTIGGTVLNIILDPIFIFGLNLGAAGAAMATVLGYLFKDVFCVIMILKKSRELSLSIKEVTLEKRYIQQIFSVGIPSALTNIMASISNIFVNQFLLPYGNDKIAAMGIALKVANVGQLALIGFSFGGLPLFGYYVGGGKKEKFMDLLHFCMKFIYSLAIVLSVVLFVFARYFILFFVEDEGLVASGTLMLRFQVMTLVFVSIVLLMTIVFQAAGDAREMFFLSISRQGVVFLIVLFMMSWLAGYYGIIASQAISDVVSAIFALVMYQNWKKKQW